MQYPCHALALSHRGSNILLHASACTEPVVVTLPIRVSAEIDGFEEDAYDPEIYLLRIYSVPTSDFPEKRSNSTVPGTIGVLA